MSLAYKLQVSGVVQGVGFRPFVYKLATANALSGWVYNSFDGVHIHVEGARKALDNFVRELSTQAPAAAKINAMLVSEVANESHDKFEIVASKDDRDANVSHTLVSPDIATCPKCLNELFDRNNKRYHYPFINCTNCGPRFTIVSALPYDRPKTSMRDFKMCPPCAREYNLPVDRRYHAQPNACFDCGPQLSWWQNNAEGVRSTNLSESDDLVKRSVELLLGGGILAIKGLGGYHLSCDATNAQAVEKLRSRKRRPDKPFALMVKDLAQAHEICTINADEAQLLEGTIRPIVLLQKHRQADCPGSLSQTNAHNIVYAVAKSLPELGLMLPYTPLQHLLLQECGRPLVMTSGNISNDPIISDVDEAHIKLGAIADAFLDNDRAILSTYDDSVVRIVNGRFQMIRRARGYAPLPLEMPCAEHNQDGILATGAEQKSTFCLASANHANVSQHLGNLQDAKTFSTWQNTIELYSKLFKISYLKLACDMHPDYLSTKWAKATAKPCLEIQHHHAHIASVLAEAKYETQAIGLAFDGTGYGIDGTIWGGEVLLADLKDVKRFAYLRQVHMPGSGAAIKNPARMAFAYLYEFGLDTHPGAQSLCEMLGSNSIMMLRQIIDRSINAPLTSSMGRLFDAISALLGICYTNSYEGQAACELEAACRLDTEASCESKAACKPNQSRQANASQYAGKYRFDIKHNFGTEPTPYILDPEPVIQAILDDICAGVSAGVIAKRFHDAVAALALEVCCQAKALTKINTVALSGGVFMNRYLFANTIKILEQNGFAVLTNQELPANDGCISYGQTAIAAIKYAKMSTNAHNGADEL